MAAGYLAEVAVAAIDPPAQEQDVPARRGRWGSVLLAALALPCVAAAQTETDTNVRELGVKWLRYRDWQPGFDRIAVNAPSIWLKTPLDARWRLEGTLTSDSISGASPRYHSAISGASTMSDERRAGDIKVTRIAERMSWSIGTAFSNENDYRSRTVSAQGSWSSEDNNRSWNAGIALTRDKIGSRDIIKLDERRRKVEVSAGLTQVLSRTDIVQVGLSMASGQGYYSDPYKNPDFRPDFRKQANVTVRWNHHVEDWGATFRSSYRRYADSFGIRSHTVTVESVFSPGRNFLLTPSIRLYSQDAARFYYNPIYAYEGTPFPAAYFDAPPAIISADQRLSAFGALSLGLKMELTFSEAWTADVKVESYQQRSAWHFIDPGSRGIAPFSASIVQLGLTRRF